MKWNFSKSITTGFLAGLLLLVILSFYTYQSSRNFYDSRLWIAHTDEVILCAKNIHRLSTEISNASRGFVITGNDIFLDSFPALKTDIQNELFTFKQLTADNPVQQHNSAYIDSLISHRIDVAENINDLRKFKSFDDARELVISVGFQLNTNISNKIIEIINEENRLLALGNTELDKNWNSFVLFFIILMFMILVVLAAVYYIIIKTWKKKEESSRLLESREDLLNNIISNSGAAIYLVNINGQFQLANTQVEDILGISKENIIGKTYFDLFPDEAAKQYTQDDREVIKELKVKEFVQQLMIGNELHTFLSVKFPIFGSDKKLEYIGNISTDITKRKKAEEQLIESKEQLELVNKELEAFSYSVSHDLRAPLRAIIGYAKILEEDFGNLLNADAHDVMKTITGSAKKMGQLIDDLLAFSRTGRKEINKAVINMDELLNNSKQEAEAAFNDKPVKWTIAVLPPALGDLALIKQVWVNLLSNAIKYSLKNSLPHIEVGSYSKDDKSIVYFVKDNGVGFDMKYADKLFQVFQRLHSSSDFEGTGIGLAIVGKIISKHGGKIWAEAEPNNGATFFFSLPAGQAGLPALNEG